MELDDVVHHPGVGRRVRSRRRADGGLVDDDGIRMLAEEGVADQRALAGPGDAGIGGDAVRFDPVKPMLDCQEDPAMEAAQGMRRATTEWNVAKGMAIARNRSNQGDLACVLEI